MKILAVAAHPDDELLGLGGTLARHAREGDQVVALIASEGASSRYEEGAGSVLQASAERAAGVLGLDAVRFLGLPDQRLDTLPLIEVTQKVEAVFDELLPDIVYVHHWGDMNRDHRVIAEAALVACRPVGDDYPRRVLAFETPSSTEWSAPEPNATFTPQHFVDITGTLEAKLEAMSCYDTELRPAPHPRSLEALRSRAAYWGQIVGVEYAEAFALVREVR